MSVPATVCDVQFILYMSYMYKKKSVYREHFSEFVLLPLAIVPEDALLARAPWQGRPRWHSWSPPGACSPSAV